MEIPVNQFYTNDAVISDSKPRLISPPRVSPLGLDVITDSDNFIKRKKQESDRVYYVKSRLYTGFYRGKRSTSPSPPDVSPIAHKKRDNSRTPNRFSAAKKSPSPNNDIRKFLSSQNRNSPDLAFSPEDNRRSSHGPDRLTTTITPVLSTISNLSRSSSTPDGTSLLYNSHNNYSKSNNNFSRQRSPFRNTNTNVYKDTSPILSLSPRADYTPKVIYSRPSKSPSPPYKIQKNFQLRGPPYCGLHNYALNCFSNSVIQVLYTEPHIRNYIMSHSEHGPWTEALGNLFSEMTQKANQSLQPMIYPNKWDDKLRMAKPDFVKYLMHDAQEYLTIVLDLLHDEMNRAEKPNRLSPRSSPTSVEGGDEVKPQTPPPLVTELPPEPKTADEAWAYHVKHVDDSFLSESFTGQIASTLTCLTCKNQSRSYMTVWQLQLDIPEAQMVPTEDQENQEQPSCSQDTIAKLPSIRDCISNFLAPEDLKGDDAPHCDRCASRQPAVKRQEVCRRFDRYLVIHLKRFAPEGLKRDQVVKINNILNVAGELYRVQSLIAHGGSQLSGGHYRALVRKPITAKPVDYHSSNWVLINDDNIFREPENSDLLEMQAKAYICIYKRVGVEEEVEVEEEFEVEEKEDVELDVNGDNSDLEIPDELEDEEATQKFLIKLEKAQEEN